METQVKVYIFKLGDSGLWAANILQLTRLDDGVEFWEEIKEFKSDAKDKCADKCAAWLIKNGYLPMVKSET